MTREPLLGFEVGRADCTAVMVAVVLKLVDVQGIETAKLDLADLAVVCLGRHLDAPARRGQEGDVEEKAEVEGEVRDISKTEIQLQFTRPFRSELGHNCSDEQYNISVLQGLND